MAPTAKVNRMLVIVGYCGYDGGRQKVRTGMDRLALALTLADEVKQLRRHDRARIGDLLAAALGRNVGGAVGPLDAGISRGRPPRLNLLDGRLVERILGLAGLLRLGEELEGVGRGEVRRAIRAGGHSAGSGGEGADGEEGRR